MLSDPVVLMICIVGFGAALISWRRGGTEKSEYRRNIAIALAGMLLLRIPGLQLPQLLELAISITIAVVMVKAVIEMGRVRSEEPR